MLSEAAVKALSSLTYQSDAQWLVNILPFGSVYWTDEMPDIHQMIHLTEQDRSEILRMFGTRLDIWDAKVLSDADRELWGSVRAQVPGWALFQRLELTDERKIARQEAEHRVAQEFEALSDNANGK